MPPLGEYLTAFDTRFSRIRRILPRSATSVTSSTRTSRRTRCESSVSCWFSSTCFTSGRRRNSVASRPDAGGLPGAEGQQVLDHALQLDAVLAQDRGDLALVGVELADRAVHQQLRALADVRERRLQLVRHVPQEAVALVRELEQALAQPLELAAEALQVVGAVDRDRIGEGALAELADGAVELAAAAGRRRGSARTPRPPRAAAAVPPATAGAGARPACAPRAPRPRRPPGRCSAAPRARRARTAARSAPERSDSASARLGPGVLMTRGADALLQLPSSSSVCARRAAGEALQLLARGAQALVLGAVQVEELRVVQHLVEARGALERGDLAEQRLAGARARDALDDDLLAGLGEIADLQHGGQDGDQAAARRSAPGRAASVRSMTWVAPTACAHSTH